MNNPATPSPHWRSAAAKQNAAAVGQNYAQVLDAFAELDAAGHRVLQRATQGPPVVGVDRVVGIALLRRAVTAFVGVRELLEASSVQPAMVVMRSHFEVFLSLRYLVFGGRRRRVIRVLRSRSASVPRSRIARR